MNIGIISINAHTKVLNFASPLHSYAFQKFLEMHGYKDTVIIDYKPVYYGKFDPKYPFIYYLKNKNAEKDPKKRKALLKKWFKLFWARRKRFNKFQKFIDTYYKTTNKCYSAKILDKEDVEEGIDCYICATDVIWKCNKNTKFDKGFFLACDTMKDKAKIAYAASRGPSVYSPEDEKKFLSYIKDIDHISVREKSLGDYIASISDIPTTHVLDPVLLHKPEFYDHITKHPKKKKKGYVLVYIVMEKAKKSLKLAYEFAKEHDLEVIELSDYLENRHIPKGTTHDVIYDIGVEEWLGYMKDAEYIFTNSFHASCFSILFNKQFFVDKRSGDKIDSLLELFDLTDRRMVNCFEKNKFIGTDIDYGPINQKREALMKTSTDFILNALKDVEEKRKAK